MAKYASGEEAMVGDVVIYPLARGEQVIQAFASDGDIWLKDVHRWLSASDLKFIRRAPSPEPEQPEVNGVYASGEKPAVGDTVECVDGYDGSAILRSGVHYEVDGVYCSTSVHLAGFKKDNNFFSHRFKLISRKEQPAVTPMRAQPLVKWPDDGDELGSLKWGTLFVLAAKPHVPCVARSHGDYVSITGESAGTISTKSTSAKVRRIQFNPANKEPVFTVI